MMYIFTIILPAILYAPLNVYFIAEVLRYKLKNTRRTYIVALVFGLIYGIGFSLVELDFGENINLVTDVVLVVTSITLMIYIGKNLIEKRWKGHFLFVGGAASYKLTHFCLRFFRQFTTAREK